MNKNAACQPFLYCKYNNNLLIVGTVRIKYLRNLFILGPHFNTTTVTIFIITSDNTVDFRFYNTIEEVQDQEDGVSV